MVKRRFWLDLVEKSWKEKNVLWLAGVRRAGKTFLCQALTDIEYFDCEIPRTRNLFDDPTDFLNGLKGKRLVLDEIHRLNNPSELLKIAADHYPTIKIIATGSSTLGASKKFKDTLSGRKRNLWLSPMIAPDLKDFNNTNLRHRLLFGGLPPFFISPTIPERDFQEWLDDYWAKDILELFRLERKASFQKFIELLLVRSGGIFEATSFSEPCEVSRTTISNYLKALEETFIAHILKPFNRRKASEIIALPKVYAMDTGFVCYYKGWSDLRNEDLGLLWEHFVLNEMQGNLQTRNIGYWRNKQGQEIDFILPQRSGEPIAVECKWSAKNVNFDNLQVFRANYPKGENYLVAQDIERSFSRSIGELSVKFVNLQDFIKELSRTKFIQSIV
ncbi:ATP-binding protein [Candidatus Saganbacteria bacterium]|nr:ATP-binding protein [Candidatus Saganbacteria bacterium]